MAKIENPKNYTGRDLETIFFRPMLSGPGASELGIKIMYNTPVPTTLQFWKRTGDILQSYGSGGWNGGDPATKFQKTINLSKVKAEVGYSAEDYFNMVYELITGSSAVNMDDLSGTELERAETSLFKDAIAESIRATMWLGDTTRSSSLKTFDGFLKRLISDIGSGDNDIKCAAISGNIAQSTEPDAAENLLKKVWDNASDMLREFKAQGNLVFLVTSDIHSKYEEELDSVVLESAYLAKQNGREALTFRGIPVVDVKVSAYIKDAGDMPASFVILTDRRNLALAVNTADFPGTEVRMWYNPDQMENRQRAVFMAGCDYLLPELVSMAAGGVSFESLTDPKIPLDGNIQLKASGWSFIESVTAQGVKSDGTANGTAVAMETDDAGKYTATITSDGSASIKLAVTCTNGDTLSITI